MGTLAITLLGLSVNALFCFGLFWVDWSHSVVSASQNVVHDVLSVYISPDRAREIAATTAYLSLLPTLLLAYPVGRKLWRRL